MDYEVNVDGVVYRKNDEDDGKSDESDPLASQSDADASDREAREEIFGPDIDTLIAETRNRRRKRKRRRPGQLAAKRRRPCDVPPILAPVMGAATLSYMERDYVSAEAALRRIMLEAPKAASPYRTLALILEERGERREALEAYMKAAALDKREKDLWKRNASLWAEEGDFEQAVYCLSRAIRASSGQDVDALRARADFRVRMGQQKKAADGYLKLAAMLPSDVQVLRTTVSLCNKAGLHAKLVPVLQAAVDHFQHGFARRDGIASKARRNMIVLEIVQMLVEVWFKQKKFSESSALLSRVKEQLSASGAPMTFEQRLLLAICQHRLGAETLASPTFIEFMSSPSMMAKHQSLLWEVADACLDSGDYQKALKAYNLLDATRAYEQNISLYLQRATCHQQLGNLDRCKDDLLAVLRIKPRHVEASMRFMEFYPDSMREKQLRENKKRRLRRREKAAVTKAAALQAVQPGRPAPDAPIAARKPTLGAIGYDYLTKGSSALSGITTGEGILLPVSYDDIHVALQILTKAEAAFAAEKHQLFLSLVGPPIEAALNLKNKMHVDVNESEDQSEDEDFDVEEEDDDDADGGKGATDGVEKNESENTSGNRGKSIPLKKRIRPAAGMKNGGEMQKPSTLSTGESSAQVSREGVDEIEEEDRLRQEADNNQKQSEIGVAMLRELEDKLFAGLLEHIFESLYHLGRIDDIEPIMSSLLAIAAIRIGPESPFKLRMQVLLVISLFATGRYYDAYNKLRSMMILSPEDPRICCLFAIAEEHMGVSSQYERFRSFRVLDRLYKKRQDLPILTYVNGLCSARGLNNSHNYTVGKYLQAYAGVPDSPLLCLCLVVHFVYVAQNRRVGNRNQIVLYAMAFLDEYRRKRMTRSANKCSLVVELEMLYNSGRTMHQLGILHMAEQLYKNVLEHADENIDALPLWADLRRDAAFNLVGVYRQSGSPDLASLIISKYLVF